jgi:hypothetical protein
MLTIVLAINLVKAAARLRTPAVAVERATSPGPLPRALDQNRASTGHPRAGLRGLNAVFRALRPGSGAPPRCCA